jgi:hypothetical protein
MYCVQINKELCASSWKWTKITLRCSTFSQSSRLNTPEYDRSQHDPPPGRLCYLPAVAYSSATFFSLRFRLRKGKVGAFQKCIISIS